MAWRLNIPHAASLDLTAMGAVWVRYPDGQVVRIKPRLWANFHLGPVTTRGRTLEVRR